MNSNVSDTRPRRCPPFLVLSVLAAVAVAACDDVLDVTDPSVVDPGALEGPEGVSTRANGVVRDFQEAYDDYVRYAAMFTDEMILSGTFQGRVEVDDRRISRDNVQITGELYEPLQRARQSTSDLIEDFEENLDDPEFSSVRGEMEVGLARAHLFAGYLRVMLAEMYCNAVTDSLGPALTPDEVMGEALGLLDEAESRADALGLADVADAARVGQARAHLWLGNLEEIEDLTSDVPTGFVHQVQYSENTDDQENELAQFTWGFSGFLIRWSVGDGTTAERANEEFAYLDEWVEQGLIDPDPGLSAQNESVPVVLQMLYDAPDRNMVVASGWEARMIEAEVELRTGSAGAAESDVNDLLTDPDQTANPMLAVNPSLDPGPFEEVDFTGDLSQDLPQLARARLAGLWLTGQRQGTLRRFAENDGIDLYPDRGGDDVCFPIVQQEVDNNPNL